MKNTKQPLHPDVYNTAINLFGAEIPAHKELKEQAAVQTVIHDQDNGRSLFVYPSIKDEAFSGTMDNYRKYVALKNFQLSEENHLINVFNQNSRNFKKENKHTIAPDVLKYAELFPKLNKKLTPTEYNQKVDEFAKEHGMLVRKKKLITIKPMAEMVFQNFLCTYNQQLAKKNSRHIVCNIAVRTPLEPFKINAWKVTQLKRNGVKSLDLCRKTILNHRKRLEEFGVLTEYNFKGRQRAVEVQINPEILVIKDLYNSKISTAENQRVTPEKGKIVPNYNEKLTRTSIKEVERNGKVDNSSLDKEFASLTPFNLTFTGTPASKQNFQTGGGGESVKVSQSDSEKALSTIISDRDLAVALENREFNNYRPIDIRFLYSLAYSGTLTREQFYDVAMIDYFKSLQKNIYKTQSVYFGTWYQAIKIFRKQRWQLFNGDVFQPHHIVAEITQYRWRIQWARSWYFKNKNVNPLFPNQYLDVTRTKRNEVGWEYTKGKWKQQQEENKKYDAVLKRREADAKRRGVMINHTKKMDTQLNRFFKNKITLQNLFDYVEKNLPPEFKAKLADLIETKALQINKKTVEVKYNLMDFE